jgi:hypothetical protein
MSAFVGILLALATCVGARLTGVDRSRAFYPCVLMAIATYDIVFATMTGSNAAVAVEVALASLFIAAALIGFRYSLWVVAVGLTVHGIADLTHDAFAPESGIPAWWPLFCCAYDVVAGVVLAVQLSVASLSSRSILEVRSA